MTLDGCTGEPLLKNVNLHTKLSPYYIFPDIFSADFNKSIAKHTLKTLTVNAPAVRLLACRMLIRIDHRTKFLR